MDMRYVDEEDGTNINLKKGLQKLKGKETLDFVRYRKSNEGTAESSDLARNGRQQQVLSQLLDKLTSFNGISQWGNVLDIAGQSVRTDVPESRIREWITQFRKLKPEHIEFVPLEGKWESPYIVPTETDLDAALTALRTRLELPDETIKESQSYPLSKVVRVESSDSKTVTKDTYNKSR
jgi:anionic cell wall polymer biosynthesis LytR-Cps2A-Psr (LCP) family protein